MPSLLDSPNLLTREVTVKLADEETKALGWTFDYEFIQELALKSKNYGGYPSGMEQVESVLMALFHFKEYGPQEVTPNVAST